MKHKPTEIIKNYIIKASMLLEESELLAKSGFYNGSLNRSYYSIYNSVKALLELKGIETKSHSGLLTMFHDHYVKTGEFSRTALDNLHRAEILREKSDYKNFFEASPVDAKEQIKSVSIFLKESIKYLENKLKITLNK